MPPSSQSASAPAGIVIPDCCNIGVVFRSLLAVNAAVFAGILMQTGGARAAFQEFAEAAMVVELATLWSLFALCVVRRLLLMSGLIGALAVWGQRVLCALVPALVTALIVRFLVSFDWFFESFAYLTPSKAMVTAAFIGLLFQHYFELRTRAYSPALVEARLQALQARIRPHFLFNSLNAVLSLIRTEPRRGESTLEDLADLFRVLMSDSRNMSTLEAEIRLCRQYLSIEKIRLGDRLHVRWSTDNISDRVLRTARVPVLLLQPLLENAVHYGVEPMAAPEPIQVHVSRTLDRLDIAVTNAWDPSSPRPGGNQMALANIRERLALLYDVEAQLITGAAGDRFEVRLRLPYSKGPL